MPVTIASVRPDPDDVLRLAAAVEQADGAPPLSDQTVSQFGSDSVTHLVARDGDDFVGYAQVADGVAEIAAEPAAVDALLDAAAADGPLRVWSHGRHSRLITALDARGFRRERELHQLRRPLDSLPADPPLDADVTVRPFVPGADDEAWLALNAQAFASHPEQGRWTSADLRARVAEPWFDPDGFLLAERDASLIGFHWTKVHPGTGRDSARSSRVGEVYVLGVSPAAQGLGLGGALLIRGLRYLAEQRRCPQALLYVDGDNPAALKLYERDGFTRYDLDVQWRGVQQGAPS